LVFVGFNPSTADEVLHNATIRRCVALAKAWGYGALCMTNLFAFRATDPDDMKAAAEPIGPENDFHLQRLAHGAGVVVAAWAIHGTHRERDAAVRSLIPTLHYLRKTADGHPGHPLYLPTILTPTPL
jgi:hypothetical protein